MTYHEWHFRIGLFEQHNSDTQFMSYILWTNDICICPQFYRDGAFNVHNTSLWSSTISYEIRETHFQES